MAATDAASGIVAIAAAATINAAAAAATAHVRRLLRQLQLLGLHLLIARAHGTNCAQDACVIQVRIAANLQENRVGEKIMNAYT